MIQDIHVRFRRWAQWVLEPGVGTSLGYGKNILVRIQEGRGSLLPGPASRVSVSRVDFVALEVEEWLRSMPRSDKFVLRVFYLSPYLSAEEKAKRLKMPVRTMYDRVEKLHQRYQQWRSLKKVEDSNNA